MTEPLYFEADSDRAIELDTLAASLGVHSEDLLNEALEMLLAAYREKQSQGESIGLLADLHGVQGRIRAMIEELRVIRFMTASVSSMLYEMGVRGATLESLCRHYEKIFQSSERALKAAGIGSYFKELPLEAEETDTVKLLQVRGEGDV
jgi:hypothetical protein